MDADLAELYETETRIPVQTVKRNRERFPKDFRREGVTLLQPEFGIRHEVDGCPPVGARLRALQALPASGRPSQSARCAEDSR